MIRTAARIFGIIYLLVGILGFIPALAPPDATMPGMSMLLGLFPINAFHNVVHLVVGLVGLGIAGSLTNARAYFKALAVVYGLLTILGLIPATNTLWGLCPLQGWDIALHAVTAIAAIYFGWSAVEAAAAA